MSRVHVWQHVFEQEEQRSGRRPSNAKKLLRPSKPRWSPGLPTTVTTAFVFNTLLPAVLYARTTHEQHTEFVRTPGKRTYPCYARVLAS
eukprot:1224486-Pleurochrysis_carterae.AAC.1